MKSYRILLLVFALLPTKTFIFGQEVLNGIARIVSNEGSAGEEIGAGIIAHFSGKEVFIVTADHVVDDAESITVYFYGLEFKGYPAQKFLQPDRSLDLVVVVTKVPMNFQFPFYSFQRSNPSAVRSQAKLAVVGHPYNNTWAYNIQNVVNRIEESDPEISISSNNIAQGFSGGALMEKKKHRLLGLVTNVGSADAKAIKITTIIEYLDRWSFSYDLIGKYRPPLKKPTYLFGGLSVGNLGGGIAFNNSGNKLYDPYKTFQDPAAFERARTDPDKNGNIVGDTRGEQLKAARSKNTLQNISFALSGVFAVAGVVINLNGNPDKKLQSGKRSSNLLNTGKKSRNQHKENYDADLFMSRPGQKKKN